MELACRTRRAGRQGRLMASPSHAFTARYVAEQLGADQDLIEEIAAMQMDPEDGVLSIIDSYFAVSILDPHADQLIYMGNRRTLRRLGFILERLRE